MSNTEAKILVKVGTRSDVLFRNVTALRAITFKEAKHTLMLNPDIKSLVIEDIRESEIDTAQEIAQGLIAEGKSVILYCSQTNQNIERFNALVSNVQKVNTLSDLHKKLTDNLGIDVGTGINKGEVQTEQKQDDSLSETISAINENVEYTEEIQHPTIESKEDLDGFEDMGVNLEKIDIENKEAQDLSTYKEKTVLDMANLLSNMAKEKAMLEEQLHQATDRIQILLEIKESVEDERDMYKNMLDELDSNSDILEDPVESSDYQKLNEELQEQKNENERLAERIRGLDAQIGEYTENLRVTTEERNNALENVANSDKIILDHTNTILQLREELQGLKDSIDPEEYARQSIEITVLSGEAAELKSRIDAEVEARLILIEMLANAVEVNSILQQALKDKNEEIENYRTSVEKLKNSNIDITGQLQQLQEKNAELINGQKDNDELKDTQLAGIQTELDIQVKSNNSLRIELETTQKLLESKEEALQAAIISAHDAANNGSRVEETNKILQETNRTLLETNNTLRKEVEETREKLIASTAINKNLETSVQQLRTGLTTMSRGAILGDRTLKLECDYTARGLILPIFGSGSYGITTTAMSIVRKLQSGRVLYMDMDVSNPKADNWFSKVPIIQELTGITVGLKKTGFGALIEKGVDYVIDNERLIMQRVIETKTGCLDYFSGSYTNIDATKLMAVRFTEFINYLGNTYNYIIVDLGRFGSSEVGDALIKMFDTIAYKSVIVTLKDKMDVRNFGVKASTGKLKLDNAIWVLNIADDTKIETLITKSVGGAQLVIMPKVMQMYGSWQSFDKVPGTKDRFNELMDRLLK